MIKHILHTYIVGVLHYAEMGHISKTSLNLTPGRGVGGVRGVGNFIPNHSFSFCFKLEVGNYIQPCGPKAALLFTFVNKVLLLYSHAYSFTYIICGCLQLQRVESLLQKPYGSLKYLLSGHRNTEKVCQPIINCAKLYLFAKQCHFQEFTFRK